MTAHDDSIFAARLRRFGPVGILAALVVLAGNLVFPPLSALLALLWARLSRTPWSELGLSRPRSVARTLVVGVVFGASFKLLMKAVVMPLLGADPINRAYHFIAGNPSAMAGMIAGSIFVAGAGEEIVFRGFLFERLRTLLGWSAYARAAVVLVTSLYFGAVHYPGQGLAGMEQATVTGLVWGTLFALTGRLWMLMVAHAAFDITAVLIIYWDLEPAVAHFIFH